MTTWRWPLPNCVPWEFPHSFGMLNDSGQKVTGAYLPAPGAELHPIHAVEDGTVLALLLYSLLPSCWGLIIEGESGLVVYEGVHGTMRVKRGDVIQRGQLLGTLASNVLSLSRFPREDLTLIMETHLLRMRSPSLLGLYPDCHPLDPEPQLREAWSHVTPRFHRDQEQPPTTPEERKQLLRWLQSHPLWREGLDDAPVCWMEPALHPDLAWVDPTCEHIVGQGHLDDPRNTDFRVWLEPIRYFDMSLEPEEYGDQAPDTGWDSYNRWAAGGLLCLNCGGAEMQEALIQLALRVKHYYGEGFEPRTDLPGGWGCRTDKDTACEDAGDGFCKYCGYLVESELSDEELK